MCINSQVSLQKTCEANAAGENSSFIFTVSVKPVPLYHFKLANVEIGHFNWSLLMLITHAFHLTRKVQARIFIHT